MLENANPQWRRRARSSKPLQADGTRSGDHDAWSLWQPDAEEEQPARKHGRMTLVSRKRQPMDLEASLCNGMFGAIVPAIAPRAGEAWLCFVAENTFVGVCELQLPSGAVTVRFTGEEAADECDREMCGADDCCGDMAFALRAVDSARGKRSFVARSTGLGDYAAFEGRGVVFQTERLCTGPERDSELRRFDSIPPEVRRDAVVCVGPMTLEWEKLVECEVATKSEAVADAEDEAGRLLAAMEAVVVPTRTSVSLDDLLAAGGTPLAVDDDDDW